jgi:Plasmid recombination enzyme
MYKFVLRVKKYKSGARLHGILAHCARVRTPRNADPARAHLNQIRGDQDPKGYGTTRKNGVAAVEIVISASPEWFRFEAGSDAWLDFVKAAVQFFERRFGGHVTLLAVHMDEKTPHCHLLFSPLGLSTSAKKMVGGSKYRMNELQSAFESEVASKFRLRRTSASIALHSKVQEFYSMLDSIFEGEEWRIVPRATLEHLRFFASHVIRLAECSLDQRQEMLDTILRDYRLSRSGLAVLQHSDEERRYFPDSSVDLHGILAHLCTEPRSSPQ